MEANGTRADPTETITIILRGKELRSGSGKKGVVDAAITEALTLEWA